MALTKLQKIAYQIEAKRYNNFDIPPLNQTREDLKNQFKDHIILKAVANGKIIGTVRAYEKNGTCFIGRLAVQPDMKNKGIGTALMKEIEKHFTPKRYELFVGLNSDNNIHLYKKLGYNIYKRDAYECGDIDIYYMEKKLKTRFWEFRQFNWPFGILYIHLDFPDGRGISGEAAEDCEVVKILARTFINNINPFDIVGHWHRHGFLGIFGNVDEDEVKGLETFYRMILGHSVLPAAEKGIKICVATFSTSSIIISRFSLDAVISYRTSSSIPSW